MYLDLTAAVRQLIGGSAALADFYITDEYPAAKAEAVYPCAAVSVTKQSAEPAGMGGVICGGASVCTGVTQKAEISIIFRARAASGGAKVADAAEATAALLLSDAQSRFSSVCAGKLSADGGGLISRTVTAVYTANEEVSASNG